MTATDELRRMLDERGVEWRRTPHYSSESQDNETIFEGNGIEWYANDHMNGRLGLRALRYEVTPEQAIEATLDGDLKAENAKLRELVRELWEGYNDPRCEECHLKDTPTCADCPICAREALVIDRTRELGIEVDG